MTDRDWSDDGHDASYEIHHRTCTKRVAWCFNILWGYQSGIVLMQGLQIPTDMPSRDDLLNPCKPSMANAAIQGYFKKNS